MKSNYLVFSIVFIINTFCFSQTRNISFFDFVKELERKNNITINYNSDYENLILNIKPLHGLQENLDILNCKYGFKFSTNDGKNFSCFRENLSTIICVDINDLVLTNTTFQINNNYYTSNDCGAIHIMNLKNPVEIKNLLFENQEIEILENQRVIVIKLQPKINYLKEIEIFEHYNQSVFSTKDGNFIIKPNQINAIAGINANESLKSIQHLPHANSENESFSYISIKGSTQDQNLYLWNGIQLYQNYHFFGLISAFNQNLIDSILIIDNATPSNYISTTGGVISFENKPYLKEKKTIGFGIDGLAADFYIKTKLNSKSDIQFSTRKSLTEYLESPIYKTYKRKAFGASNLSFNDQTSLTIEKENKLNFYDLQSIYNYSLSANTKIKINSLLLGNALEYTEFNNLTNEIRESQLNQNHFALGFELDKENSKNIRSNFITSYVTYIQEGKNNTIIDNNLNTQKNIISQLNSKLEITKKYSKAFSLSLGGQLDIKNVTNTTINHRINFSKRIKQEHYTTGIFSQLNYNTEKINSFLAVRNIYYDFLNKITTEPRLFINYQISSQNSIFLKSEVKSQDLLQILDLENNFLGIEKRKWYLANDSIAPIQRSFQIEVGYNRKKAKNYFSASVFYKKISGITTYSQGFQNYNQFEIEFGDANYKGFLFHFHTNINSVKTWISYTYSVNNYKFNNLNPPIFQLNNYSKHRIITGVNYKWKGINFASTFEWYKGKYFTPIAEKNPVNNNGGIYTIVYGKTNSSNLPDYSRIDFSFSKKIEFKTYDMNINLGVLNVFNTNNLINKFFTIRNNSEHIEELNYYGLKFAPNISLQFTFR